MPSSWAAWAIASAVCPVLTMLLKAIPAASAFPTASLRALADACEAASCHSLPVAAPLRLLLGSVAMKVIHLAEVPITREARPENHRPGPKPLTEPMRLPLVFGNGA